MENGETQNLVSAFAADIREYCLMLDEFGVSGLETSFIAEETAPKTNVGKQMRPEYATPSANSAMMSRELPETLLVEPPKISAAPKFSPPEELTPSRLSSKLASLKLSNRRAPEIAEDASERAKRLEILQNNLSKISKEEKMTDNNAASSSLFGDIAPVNELPPSGETMEEIRADIGECTRCRLCETRTNIVHTEGNPQARLMFIGEAPGADEDATGRPFVGRAGQLLNKIIEAIGLRREEVLIGNINRCRPPQNRQPKPDEVAMCKPFILRDIAAVRPEVIVVLGNTACQNLLDTKQGITKLRGEFQDYMGVKVMPTFHPAYLLRDPTKKRETWEDMKKVRDFLAENKTKP